MSADDHRPPTHEALVKMITVTANDRNVDASNKLVEEESRVFQDSGALVPPYHPRTLTELHENSSLLRQNVDAYSTNIDGHGYHLEATINVNSDDVSEQVANAIYHERLAAREAGQVIQTLVPTEQEVADRLARVSDEMLLERFRVEQFFQTCTVKESFIALRRHAREDLEITGNAFWEVLRDKKERCSQFEYLPAHTMRLMREDRRLIDVTVPVRTSPLSVGTEKLRQRFRKFVQVVGLKAIYFKEFGDPRTMSATTGVYYDNNLQLQEKERGTPQQPIPQATEVIHFRIHAASSPYGIPRWIGALLSVLGTRYSEEVNYLYFENKTVPPMALLVSGASLTKETVPRLESFLENNKGKQNFHKILIIEAESQSTDPDGTPGGRIRLELKPLTQAQQSDALFQRYDERNMDKVGMAFRLPRLLRGDVRDFNRATGNSALEFAETQVFGPERYEFDHFINRYVLGPMGIRYWTFQSNSVQVRDPRAVAEIIRMLAGANVIVPADGRQLAEELVFGRKLKHIDADWMYQPPMLTQVGVQADETHDGTIPGGPGAKQPTANGTAPQAVPSLRINASASGRRERMSNQELVQQARELIRLHEALLAEEARIAKEQFHDGKRDDDAEPEAEQRKSEEVPTTEPEVQVIRMPLEKMIRDFNLKAL